MPEDNLSYDDYCRIIGGIYLDAYIRIHSLEEENNKLKREMIQQQSTTVMNKPHPFDNTKRNVGEAECLNSLRSGNENSM